MRIEVAQLSSASAQVEYVTDATKHDRRNYPMVSSVMSPDTRKSKQMTRSEARALNLRTYQNGKDCPHGHINPPRNVDKADCNICYGAGSRRSPSCRTTPEHNLHSLISEPQNRRIKTAVALAPGVRVKLDEAVEYSGVPMSRYVGEVLESHFEIDQGVFVPLSPDMMKLIRKLAADSYTTIRAMMQRVIIAGIGQHLSERV